MKKQKLIASVLIASMTVSLCGCSADNKAVIAVADEYAKAIIELDADDISDLLEDSDDSEAQMEMLEDAYHGNQKTEKVFDVIADSMSYEIDEKSVQSSKKDGKASVSITFKLVDYEEIYDEVFDDGGDIDDYIEALEDDDGETIKEITIDVDLVYKKDEWLVKDKKAKNLRKVYEFVEDILGYNWCNYDAVSMDDFEAALYEVYSADSDDMYSYEEFGYEYLSYSASSSSISISVYDDPIDAEWDFEEMYDDFTWNYDVDEDMGLYEYYYDEDEGNGYLIFDGSVAFSDDGYSDIYMYGGMYLNDDTLVMALSFDTQPIDKGSYECEKIDSLLSAIGYPLP